MPTSVGDPPSAAAEPGTCAEPLDLEVPLDRSRLNAYPKLNAAGNPVSQAQLEKVYQRAQAAYQKANAAKNLVLEAAK